MSVKYNKKMKLPNKENLILLSLLTFTVVAFFAIVNFIIESIILLSGYFNL